MNDMVKTKKEQLAEIEAQLEGVFRGAFFDTCRLLWQIRNEQLYVDDYASFDDYCRDRWNFTGTRGRQLADTYEVAENLRKTAKLYYEDMPLILYSMFFDELKEGQARALKHLPPEMQVDAWEVSHEVADGDKPTARIVDQVVSSFQVSREDLEAMPAVQQQNEIKKIEAAATAAYARQRLVEYALLTLKRIKRAIADGRHLGPEANEIVNLLEQTADACQELLSDAREAA